MNNVWHEGGAQEERNLYHRDSWVKTKEIISLLLALLRFTNISSGLVVKALHSLEPRPSSPTFISQPWRKTAE